MTIMLAEPALAALFSRAINPRQQGVVQGDITYTPHQGY
jgi:hypothetical protein